MPDRGILRAPFSAWPTLRRAFPPRLASGGTGPSRALAPIRRSRRSRRQSSESSAPRPGIHDPMIRLIIRFLLLAAAAAFFACIADRPGTAVIRWMNREIETSVLAAFAAVILLVLALWLMLALLRSLI